MIAGCSNGSPRGRLPPPVSRDIRLGALTLGCAARPRTGRGVEALLVAFVNAGLAQGGTVLIPEGDPLVAEPAFVQGVLGEIRPHATLAYGQPVARPGCTWCRPTPTTGSRT